MYTAPLQHLLTQSRRHDLGHLAAPQRIRQPLTAPRPRRWRLRSPRPSLVVRAGI
jgi:hypothetical protein